MPGDTLQDSVTLLLSFDGSHGSTSFVDTSVNPKTVSAIGQASLSTADKKWGTASLAVDGSGDYANVPATADFAFGLNDFTVECWFKTTSTIVYVDYTEIFYLTGTNVIIGCRFASTEAQSCLSWTILDADWANLYSIQGSNNLNIGIKMKPQSLPRIAETSTETADKMLFESAMSRHQGVTSQFSAGIEYRVQTGEAVVGIWDAAKRVGTIFKYVDESTDQKKDKLIKPVTDKSEGDAMLYEFTGGGVVVDKSGAVKKDGKPVALKFEKLKGKLWLLVGDGDGDQDRIEVPAAQSGDMAAAVDWLVMSWKTVMKILATNNMQESIEQPA